MLLICQITSLVVDWMLQMEQLETDNMNAVRDNLLQRFDKDHDKTISFNEFVHLYEGMSHSSLIYVRLNLSNESTIFIAYSQLRSFVCIYRCSATNELLKVCSNEILRT